ncbi:hypothetical protein Taro_046368 [Colocasia esculenta]|uniref:Uncharacterized protein n=1 Tax=Colocasia esculenta TaxID=4460 RepID=A0A843X618_COLES|nr:hypothetical protein [Colocasia esculenta]
MLRTQSKNMKNWSSSVDTSSSSVDTRDSFPELSGSNWDSVSTLDEVVSTLESFPEHFLGCFGTVAADTTGKKNDLVWMISCSPTTKNFSSRLQQVLKLVPRVVMRIQWTPMGQGKSDEHPSYEEMKY